MKIIALLLLNFVVLFLVMSEKVPPDLVNDPYADYVTLLSPTFTPARHANSLVHATNDPSDKITDLTSPMQRIRYDLEEVNRRIDQLVFHHSS